MLDAVAQAAVELSQPTTLLMLVIGSAWGIVAGALPGVTPSMGMAILLPLTFTLSPYEAMVLLAATWSGSEYGGAIPAVLINTPGTPAASATSLDGHPLYLQGKGGIALGHALVWGLIGQIISVVFVVLMLFPLTVVILQFGPAELLAFSVFGLSLVASFASRNVLKAILSALLGLIVASVGFDPFAGVERLTFGVADLMEGPDIIAVLMGMFAIAELLARVATPNRQAIVKRELGKVLPSVRELASHWRTGLWSTGIGILVGIMPGAGSSASAFVAYGEARRRSKHPETYGKGAVEGVVACETANNAEVAGALVPMLGFGVPGSTSAAVFMSGLMIQGIRPGPGLFTDNLALLVALFAALIITNPVVLAVGLALIKPCIKLVGVSEPVQVAGILALVVTGAFAISNSEFEILVMLVFGVVGWGISRFGFSQGSLILALVLGETLESNLRRVATLGNGGIGYLLTQPIAVAFLSLAALTLIYPMIQARRRPDLGPLGGPPL